MPAWMLVKKNFTVVNNNSTNNKAPSAHHSKGGEGDGPEKQPYRIFVEDVADGFYETDRHGNFTFFNHALCRIFGYEPHEIQGRNYREFMDRKNADLAFESFNRVYRTGQGFTDITWEITRKDGQQRILEISTNLIYDANRAKVGFQGIARDVTEKSLAQRALQQSQELAECQYTASRRAEKRYRALLNFLPIPVFVSNPDNTVSFFNPAFERVFGWSFKEMAGKRIPVVPDDFKTETRDGLKKLLKDKEIHHFETKRLNKEQRLLDIILDGAVFYDEENQPAGQVLTLRDVTREKRNERSNQAFFRISKALYQFRELDERLDFITKEVQALMDVEGALVILIDDKQNEFFFRAAAWEDSDTEKKYKEIRMPMDKGIASQVCRRGEPMIVHDYQNSPYSFHKVDEQTGLQTRDMLQVPIQTDDRMIGVLCAVNKKTAAFDQADADLLSSIAGIVALPLENARINQELKRSYQEVQSLNRAKDRVIHHLSHELKTPVAVLDASLGLLETKLAKQSDQSWRRILKRAQRNLDRLLEMQYEIEDLLTDRDYRTYHMLSTLLAACTDELEVLAATAGCEEEPLVAALKNKIEALFGPHEYISEEIQLDQFVKQAVDALRPRFAHRKCRLKTDLHFTSPVFIPKAVLKKIVTGLIRNAVEYTPDGGQITVAVRNDSQGPQLEVIDNGIGMSKENQRLLFENFFTAYETMQYSTKQPFDFNAGGRGFDLLRMKIFSERYHFKIRVNSKRCQFLSTDENNCPGDIENCEHCQTIADCHQVSGTTFTVQFTPSVKHATSEKPMLA